MTKKFLSMAMAALLSSGAMAQPEKKAYMVADAHLDTQWNWDVQTTIREYVKHTLDQNLMLLKKYPHYIFNFEGAVKYNWMKEYYPLQYAELKHYVANGRWHLTGSSWDANETIVCSPESWLRNILLGQTFYRKEFNTESTDVFLPDCFGFGYTLPTLAAHCGLIGFSSQKLVWRTNPFYEGGKRYPYTIGLWQGIDGSRIMMAHGFGYAERYRDEDLSQNQQLLREIGESSLNQAYRYYGTGDIGGSPTIASVRGVEKGIAGNGPIKIVSATSDQLYKDYLPFDKHPELPVFDGELPMDVHGNGCYTSQAAMKLYNRQNEHLGDAAERTAVMADWLGASRYPATTMTETWQRFIWHQFHDDLTGTSIPRAYEFSWNDELLSLKKFSDVLTHSVSGVAGKMDTRVAGQPVVVYNNETTPVRAIAQVVLSDNRDYSVADSDGRKVASQIVERNGQRVLLFNADVPATGMAVYGIKAAGKKKQAAATTGRTIESSRYKLTVDAYGDVVSLIDKNCGREIVASGKSLRLVVFDDCRSEAWPAWEIQKATLDKAPLPVHDGVEISIEPGTLRQTLVIKKKYGESDIIQRIHLYEGAQADRIDFENEVDWRSLNALLKAEFPLSVSNKEATYDIGLGSVRRGNNRDNSFEVYAHEWTDLTNRNGNYGVTLLNDSRYGWDKPNDNTLRLSLLYSPKPGRSYTYQARQDFGHHVFTYSLVGHEGPLDPVKAVRQADRLNSPLRTFYTERHPGSLGKKFSFVTSDNDCVVVRALKRAEVSDEYVVRVYEMNGQGAQKARLTFPAEIIRAVEADGTERTLKQAKADGRSLLVDIKPYSVKTYKVVLAKQKQAEPDVQPLALDYDRHCFCYNEFRSSGNFEGGYSYAAELLPDEGITVGDIPFCFGEKDAASGVTCKGQTIQLPAGKDYRRLYLLVASDRDDRQAVFTVNGKQQTVSVPYYTGFIGQWGHDGQTTGYLKDAEVAWIGSHRHSAEADEPYEFTYMFRVCLDIPKGAREIVLPSDEHVVVFAATLANDAADAVAAAPLFKTSILPAEQNVASSPQSQINLLRDAKIVGTSGEVNEGERAALLMDGDPNTKWCDAQAAPNYVTFDFGKPTTISRWRLLSAACEQSAYITRTCLLQGRNSETDEWQTLDMFDGNRNNYTDRNFAPTTVRYLRLFVVAPTQGQDSAARIYELEVF
jgi:alpha-mannosidase